MARPRNNIVKLPRQVRMHISELLDAGLTYDEVRGDADVAAACAARGLMIHNNSFLAYRGSLECREFIRLINERDHELERNGVAATLAATGAADDIAQAANYELLRIVLKKLDAQRGLDADDLDTKELASISSALAAYERNRIAAGKEDDKRAAAAKEAEYQAKIAELAAQVAAQAARINELSNLGSVAIDGRKVAAALDAALGVR